MPTLSFTPQLRRFLETPQLTSEASTLRPLLEEAFAVRREPVRELRVFAVEHTVERVGCALAAIVLLAEPDLA